MMGVMERAGGRDQRSRSRSPRSAYSEQRSPSPDFWTDWDGSVGAGFAADFRSWSDLPTLRFRAEVVAYAALDLAEATDSFNQTMVVARQRPRPLDVVTLHHIAFWQGRVRRQVVRVRREWQSLRGAMGRQSAVLEFPGRMPPMVPRPRYVPEDFPALAASMQDLPTPEVDPLPGQDW